MTISKNESNIIDFKRDIYLWVYSKRVYPMKFTLLIYLNFLVEWCFHDETSYRFGFSEILPFSILNHATLFSIKPRFSSCLFPLISGIRRALVFRGLVCTVPGGVVLSGGEVLTRGWIGRCVVSGRGRGRVRIHYVTGSWSLRSRIWRRYRVVRIGISLCIK